MIKQRLAGALQADDRGVVAVMVALLAIVIFGIGAFAVDMGIAYASKREQSVTSDAAALAGAQAAGSRLQTLYPNGTACTSAVASALSGAATTAATEVYVAQRPQSSANPTVTVQCDGANAIDVTVQSNATFDTVFGGVLGVGTLNPDAAATARVSGAPAYGGLRPFAVCDSSIVRVGADGKLPENLTQQSLYVNNPPGNTTKPGVTCGPLPAGNWGIVDFDGGSNTNGDIADWTRYGYNGPITIPDPAMPGDPGVDTSAPVKSALDSIIGDIVLLPVAEAWNQDASGNNASFQMSGVIAVEICGYQDGKKPAVKGGCWSDALADKNLNPDPAVAEADFKLQWQLRPFTASYLPGGSGSAECSLSDATCLPAVRLYR